MKAIHRTDCMIEITDAGKGMTEEVENFEENCGKVKQVVVPETESIENVQINSY